MKETWIERIHEKNSIENVKRLSSSINFIRQSSWKLRRAGFKIKQYNEQYLTFSRDNLAGMIHVLGLDIVFAAGKIDNKWHMGIDLNMFGLTHPKQVYCFNNAVYLEDRNIFLNIMLKSKNYDNFRAVAEQQNIKELLKKL